MREGEENRAGSYRFLPRDLSAGALAKVDVFRVPFRDVFRRGTFPPFSRASLRPIAIACLRLVTVRPEPLFSVPFFFRRIADATLFDAALPYFAIGNLRLQPLQTTC